ncbi:hypothetical protein SAMN05216480_101174 [Pustulibacterium marinum]|uniref:BclA C-terminal domain-containing protein n=1 Tax=Pustulibacterium marinum TaxID=1224947 RepID=A0A1I7EU92_9FLAO|nr:hypothetical protein [Pustulibacterium marinum]SFU27458.1 hypothetical protein SAMN05216480_101174 [Pustulibacterium marinum]
MRKIILLIGGFFIASFMNAQVGIKTTDPQATLDVNGDARIVNTPAGSDASAKDSIMVVDGSGFVKKVTAGQVYTQIIDSVRNEINSGKSVVKAKNNGSSISIGLLSWYKIPFNIEDFDTGNEFSTSNYSFTAANSGIFKVRLQIKETLSVGTNAAIFKNGSVYEESSSLLSISGYEIIDTYVQLSAGDTMSFYFWVTLSTSLSFNNPETYVTIEQIY